MAQTAVFKGTARKVVMDEEGTTFFMYHNTAVVTVSSTGRVTLNTDGYRSNTTKLAMNQVSNQYAYGFRVYQERGNWFVSMEGSGAVWLFEDGMSFTVEQAHEQHKLHGPEYARAA